MSLDKCVNITDQCTVTVISTILAMHSHKKLQECTTIIRFITFSVAIKNKIIMVPESVARIGSLFSCCSGQ